MTEGNNIVIIGCGYIGKRLAIQLQHKGIEVTGYVSSRESVDACTAQHIHCQSINLDASIDALNLCEKDIIYLAPPPRSGKTDTRMTHFLRAIRKHASSRFVLISTTGVYGNCDGTWIDETSPVNPGSDRAFRRVDAEQQAQQFCLEHGIPLVILRVPGIYGPQRIPLSRIESREPIVCKEDSPYSNRIHAVDLVNICERALLDSNISGIYNATDGHPSTMYEYITGVAAAMNLPQPPEISLQEAQQHLSPGMLSYMAESRHITNNKLLKDFAIDLIYPDLKAGLSNIS